MRKTKSLTRNAHHPGTPRPGPASLTNAPLDKFPPPIVQESSMITTKESLTDLKKDEKIIKESTSITTDSMPIPGFLIWAKNDPFDFGVLSQYPCPKIGINILRKISEYCRDKPGHFPQLSLSQWLHICKYKLLWDNLDYTVAYFRVFDILNRQCGFWANGKLQSKTTSTKIPNPVGEAVNIKKLKDKEKDPPGEADGIDEVFYKSLKQGVDQDMKDFKVDTLQFILFLYIQHFRRLHKKFIIRPSNNLKQSGGNEIWPKLWKSGSCSSSDSGSPPSKRNLSNSPSSTTATPNIPEIQHAELIGSGIKEFIDFLMIFNRKLIPKEEAKQSEEEEKVKDSSSDPDPDPDLVSTYIMKALSFLLGAASTSLDKEFRTLESCLSLPEVSRRLMYNRLKRTVSKRCLINWILMHIKVNPWGPSCIPIPQVEIAVLTGVYDKDGESYRKNRLFWNTQNYPKAWILVSGIEKQVANLNSFEPMSSIKVHRCVDCYLYITGTHQMVIMQKCHRVTINLGVVTKSVKIQDCSEITLCGVGRLFLINDVRFSTFHLLTPSPPIISGSRNREITLAPFNTTYPNLLNDMKAAGISPKFQQWNKPLELTTDGYCMEEKRAQQSNVAILPLEKFTLSLYPFKFSGNRDTHTPTMAELLPLAYYRRVEVSLEKVDEIKNEYKEKLLSSEEDSNLIYQITLQRFKKWLKESGRIDQVIGLCSLQKTLQQKSPSPIVCSKGHDLNCIQKSVKSFFCDAADGKKVQEKIRKKPNRKDGPITEESSESR